MEHIQFTHKVGSKNLILFIHGFTGGFETWHYPKKEEASFPNLFKNDKEISNTFDIAMVNYYTRMVSFEKFNTVTSGIKRVLKLRSKVAYKNVSIDELGNLLKTIINAHCSSYENIIIVAHSMGGIVTKSYILKELSEGSSKIKLFISLAVPHNGVDWATIGNKLYSKNEQVLDLGASSASLNEINNRWIQQKTGLPRMVYFYGHSDRVVPKNNAIGLQIDKQEIEAFSADHFTICKPDSFNDLIYLITKKTILDFFTAYKVVTEHDKLYLREKANYDNEIFFLKLLISKVHEKFIVNAKDRFFDAEYMRKVLANHDIDLVELNTLYDKIEQIHTNMFVAFSMDKAKGENVNSNILIQSIYNEIISKDKEFLESFSPIVGVLEKMGMLHQLANSLKKDIWWEEGQTIEDINNLKRSLQSE